MLRIAMRMVIGEVCEAFSINLLRCLMGVNGMVRPSAARTQPGFPIQFFVSLTHYPFMKQSKTIRPRAAGNPWEGTAGLARRPLAIFLYSLNQ